MSWREVTPGFWVNTVTSESYRGSSPPQDYEPPYVPPSGDVDLGDEEVDGEDPYGEDFEGFEPPEFGAPGRGTWEEYLKQHLGEIVLNAAVEAGEDPLPITNMFNGNWDAFLQAAYGELFSPGFGMDPGSAVEYYTQTSEGWKTLLGFGMRFYGGIDSDLTPFMSLDPPSRGGPGRGGGARGRTPQQIRDSFDLDELANRADRLKQGLVLEPWKDPRGLARAYVDAVVAGKGEKKIDFDTFVEERVKETGRFKSIYRSLPPGMDPRQYIAPIYQMAVQAAPREAEARAIGAAQFGASSQQLASRLQQTDTVTGSSPFLNKVYSRLSQLRGVLRG